MADTLEPESIQLNTGNIVIHWKDGHRSIYSPHFLRLRCPCAHCLDEWTGSARLDPQSVPSDIKSVDSMPVGNYAVQFLWSDAHYTGLYTYQFLRNSCPCEVCVADADIKPD